MSRAFYLSGMVSLLLAVILSLFASISLPYLPPLDVVRVGFNGSTLFNTGAYELREFGIWWGACFYEGNLERKCFRICLDYTIGGPNPTATGFVAIAAGFAAFKRPITAPLTSFLAALLLLIAFGIDLALLIIVHHEIGRLDDAQAHVYAGAVITFESHRLLLFASSSSRPPPLLDASFPIFSHFSTPPNMPAKSNCGLDLPLPKTFDFKAWRTSPADRAIPADMTLRKRNLYNHDVPSEISCFQETYE
ncbi:hypothetical protein B0H16DRAFT_1746932 [Mycena metata]|uniref:Pali-domain-containing protein n=1 Tax=Mycena metata TaxID=1033252 RepID=A0AAD7GVZ3_9AGAR|nr:hypothetical protein B0H16DRAFT_1746932 [Mycena metata]